MSIWLQTPIRQVEARLEARLQHLLQLLAWAADNGVPPQDALRSMRASWGVLAVQMILGIGWIGGPLAIFLGPLRKINLAVIKLEKDLAGGIPLVGDLVGQRRAGPFLAVLVVATPCPLLIAIPVAIIGRIGWPMTLPQRSSG